MYTRTNTDVCTLMYTCEHTHIMYTQHMYTCTHITRVRTTYTHVQIHIRVHTQHTHNVHVWAYVHTCTHIMYTYTRRHTSWGFSSKAWECGRHILGQPLCVCHPMHSGTEWRLRHKNKMLAHHRHGVGQPETTLVPALEIQILHYKSRTPSLHNQKHSKTPNKLITLFSFFQQHHSMDQAS